MNKIVRENLLEIKNLTRKFKYFTLDNVSFSLPKGYIMGFIGPNGAGKTTTIKSILNMIHRDGGEINILGYDNIKEENIFKAQIGIVMDYCYYAGSWTLTHLEKILRNFYSEWNSEEYFSFLEKFQLNRKAKVNSLSRGMSMKLMIAVALCHNAKLLILDEPTSGLDPLARDELTELLLDFIADGERSVLFSTHITSDLEKIADYITFIKNGKIIFCGEKDTLTETFTLIKGGVGEISESQRNVILGYTEYKNYFDGLISSENLSLLPASVQRDSATLEDIMKKLYKEDIAHV